MSDSPWHQSACILCECNCGIEIRLGGDSGTRFERIRGDKTHPGSQGYTCEKALRLDHYQHQSNRVTSPMRRNDDGTWDAIDWDTAIREIAERFTSVRDEFGGESIFYYGGGGQGNHLGGAYSSATLKVLGAKYRASALSQEKTGEFWVNAQMVGAGVVRADFEHAEVAVFVGKNPWQSHGIPHARTVLKEIANDPNRSLVVIDPKRSETADLADFHLQVRPATDAFCLAALIAVIVQEGLARRSWIDDRAVGYDEILAEFGSIDVGAYAARCGVDEALIRAAARRIADANGVAVFEDLGVQMNRHSTLNSWLEKLLWALTGNFGTQGGAYVPTMIAPLVKNDAAKAGRAPELSPVVGARILGGLVPCNVIPEEILTDHPRRYRAMLVESGNPAHSLADSQRMREALQSLELLVVIDIAMTETARLAHYVLPAATQYEKWEATFFNFEFPHNVFHLRKPMLDAPDGVLPEPEIHARLVEALGAIDDANLAPLRAAAAEGRAAFADAFFAATAATPELGALAPVVLYRTLGPTLPDGATSAAVLWAAAHRTALAYPSSVRRAGFAGEGLALGEALFDAILAGHGGVTFSIDEWDDQWARVKTPDGRIHLVVPELLDELRSLPDDVPLATDEYPFVLSAGERRSFTANTIIRDPGWRKRDVDGALRLSPADASGLGVETGGRVRVVTARGSAEVVVEVSESMSAGHISLPNGMGLDQPVGETMVRTGVAPNELTSGTDRDWLAGTPWHKSVPARLEPVG
jgi:anaerobic selenocysteine-containing dehydrogenase